jgi:predicted outer membrane repeat protein
MKIEVFMASLISYLNHTGKIIMKIMRCLVFIGIFLTLTHFITPSQPVYAGNAVVSTCNFVSLQTAISTANSGGGTITFTCSGTIAFTSELIITANVTINGGGTIIFDGGGSTRFFFVNTGALLTLDSLTLQNGNAMNGGAILAEGTLTIANSTFVSNTVFDETTTARGGAILAEDTLTVSNSTFNNNSALGSNGLGGAIVANGATTISNSTFESNLSVRNGGAIIGTDTLTISNSTFESNLSGENGGAIIVTGTLITISNSTFNNNSASGGGGAILTTNTLTISNSTFNNNRGLGGGGALRTFGTSTVTHSTFANHAVNTLNNSINTLTVTHSIISGTGTLCTSSGTGVLNINNTNLSNAVCESATVFANLGLGTFDGRIIPLTHSSVAVNHYPPPCAVPTDQLGNNRPFGFACDVGAVEFSNLTFTEQELLASMQTESIANNSPIYPLVLDVVTNGMEIALRDDLGQIGTATISLLLSDGVLQIGISQTTGIFGDVINAELTQIVMWALDNLFAQVGVVDVRIRIMTINTASINFEMGSP